MRFYVTTPIYYVSDVPHLGHAYTTIVCDALARYHRMRGHATRFLTGTDDHGQKIARLAEAKGVTPRAYADEYADAYRRTWKSLEISNDDFIRTTDPDHEATVQELWRAMERNGWIYEGEYEGWYCVPCEQYYTEKELSPGNKCPVHDKPVDRVKEKSLYFKLSAFEKKLLDHYQQHPEFIQPEMRRNEVTAFVRSGLQDLSISRSTFKWGIPVPDKPDRIIYVWLDALCNYYSATRRSDEARRFWDDPESDIVHVIGKEISRFHAVFWPAFLMAAGWPLPKTVFAHGWWTVDGQKMSKTTGNVVDPVALATDLGADIGVDAFRYFVLREVPLGADGDFSHEALLVRYNAELANDLGNLLNRTLGMVAKYNLSGLTAGDPLPEAAQAREAMAAAMDQLAPSVALQGIWGLVRALNTYIDKQAPWSATEERRRQILGSYLEGIRFLGNLVDPFMPERAAEMRRQIGITGPARWPTWGEHGAFTVGPGTPLFPRIDDDKKKELLVKWAPKQKDDKRISFDEFQKLDLRVARVVAAEPIPKAKKLLKLEVDLGGERRQVVAGIAESYQPAELVGKKVILLANLEPATIRGVESQGMILAAGEAAVLGLSGVDRDVPEGTKIR
jgi:methionyl-tRNA synthetase